MTLLKSANKESNFKWIIPIVISFILSLLSLIQGYFNNREQQTLIVKQQALDEKQKEIENQFEMVEKKTSVYSLIKDMFPKMTEGDIKSKKAALMFGYKIAALINDSNNFKDIVAFIDTSVTREVLQALSQNNITNIIKSEIKNPENDMVENTGYTSTYIANETLDSYGWCSLGTIIGPRITEQTTEIIDKVNLHSPTKLITDLYLRDNKPSDSEYLKGNIIGIMKSGYSIIIKSKLFEVFDANTKKMKAWVYVQYIKK